MDMGNASKTFQMGGAGLFFHFMFLVVSCSTNFLLEIGWIDKVLGVSVSFEDGVSQYHEGKRLITLHVFSLRNHTWNTFETKNFYTKSEWVTCLIGAIHFGVFQVIDPLDDCYPILIAAFDLEKDKFNFLALSHDSFDEQSIIGNCVCVTPQYSSHSIMNEYLIMRHYGVKESWTGISLVNSFENLKPLCSLGNHILSVLDWKLVLFDPKDGTYEDFVSDGLQEYFDHLLIAGMEDLKFDYAEVYSESLISPNFKTNFLISEGAPDFDEFSAGAVEGKLTKRKKPKAKRTRKGRNKSQEQENL